MCQHLWPIKYYNWGRYVNFAPQEKALIAYYQIERYDLGWCIPVASSEMWHAELIWRSIWECEASVAGIVLVCWCTVLRYCAEVPCWGTTLMYRAEVLHWCTVLRYCTDVPCWGTVLRYCTDVPCWCTVLRYCADGNALSFRIIGSMVHHNKYGCGCRVSNNVTCLCIIHFISLPELKIWL